MLDSAGEEFGRFSLLPPSWTLFGSDANLGTGLDDPEEGAPPEEDVAPPVGFPWPRMPIRSLQELPGFQDAARSAVFDVGAEPLLLLSMDDISVRPNA